VPTTGIHRETVQQWRSRWLAEVPRLTAAEVTQVSDKELLAMIEALLKDEPREGTQVHGRAKSTQIIALATKHRDDRSATGVLGN